MKIKITARVTYTQNKVMTMTYVVVMAGVQEVATRHLSGRYSQEQAMVEFRRFPEKFSPTAEAGRSVETLRALAKVA